MEICIEIRTTTGSGNYSSAHQHELSGGIFEELQESIKIWYINISVYMYEYMSLWKTKTGDTSFTQKVSFYTM